MGAHEVGVLAVGRRAAAGRAVDRVLRTIDDVLHVALEPVSNDVPTAEQIVPDSPSDNQHESDDDEHGDVVLNAAFLGLERQPGLYCPFHQLVLRILHCQVGLRTKFVHFSFLLRKFKHLVCSK